MIAFDTRLAGLSSPDLLAALERTAAEGRELTADLVALLAECDERRLYAEEGYGSLFEFCVERLRLSEQQAYHRIQAARAARRFPLVLERLREGRITLTAVALLRKHLTDANHQEVLDWAVGRRKREVEMFIRGLDPRPDERPSIRRLPQAGAATGAAADPVPAGVPSAQAPGTAAELPGEDGHPESTGLALESAASTPALFEPSWSPVAPSAQRDDRRPPSPEPACEAADKACRGGSGATAALAAPSVRRAEVRPLAPARYSLHVTISEETHGKLRRAQDLLRHALPSGDPAAVLDRALTLLVEQLEKRKAGAPPRHGLQAPGSAIPVGTVAAHASKKEAPRAKRGSRSDIAGRADRHCENPPPGTSPGRAAETRCTPADTPHRRSRYIPAAIRRAVWERDQGRCAYMAPNGTRCGETGRLEFHHRLPFADGGPSAVENLSLACVRHNRLEAEHWFGEELRRSGSPSASRTIEDGGRQ